jgi:hypothetical protein
VQDSEVQSVGSLEPHRQPMARGCGARAHQIVHHVEHNLHGTARGHDAIHWRSVPLENGVQHSSEVLVAGIVLGFPTGRGGAGGPTR